MKCPVSCPQCERLEHRYQVVLEKLHLTVDRRFNTLSDKLRELYKWQDVRDDVARALHVHKRVHVSTACKHKGANSTESDHVSSRIA